MKWGIIIALAVIVLVFELIISTRREPMLVSQHSLSQIMPNYAMCAHNTKLERGPFRLPSAAVDDLIEQSGRSLTQAESSALGQPGEDLSMADCSRYCVKQGLSSVETAVGAGMASSRVLSAHSRGPIASIPAS